VISKIVYVAYATAACYARVAHDQALFPQIVRQFAAHDREGRLPFLGGKVALAGEQRRGIPVADERTEVKAPEATWANVGDPLTKCRRQHEPRQVR